MDRKCWNSCFYKMRCFYNKYSCSSLDALSSNLPETASLNLELQKTIILKVFTCLFLIWETINILEDLSHINEEANLLSVAYYCTLSLRIAGVILITLFLILQEKRNISKMNLVIGTLILCNLYA
jgi:hypothetical protein